MSLAPVLVAVIAALLLVRPAAAVARAGPPGAADAGVVGPLSLALGGRAGGSTVLPLLALLTALTTAAFGGSVLAGVADARERASVFAVGADARVDNLDPRRTGVEDRVRRAPGVEDVTPVKVSYTALAGNVRVSLAGVEPHPYAELKPAAWTTAPSTRTRCGPPARTRCPRWVPPPWPSGSATTRSR
ncbi:hypothetical protein SALBM217S_04901 [Streptomyces griseoloalbus]